jgi:hypothetical protein
VRKPGKHTLTYHYRWINGDPLRDGKDALDVNWLAISLINDDGKTTYKGAFATSLEITRDNVEQIAACGRARWKIENETFKEDWSLLEHLERSGSFQERGPFGELSLRDIAKD